MNFVVFDWNQGINVNWFLIFIQIQRYKFVYTCGLVCTHTFPSSPH